MRRRVFVLALGSAIVSLIAGGCGGGDQESTPKAAAGSSCESSLYKVKTHGIDCESANAVIVLLDGRSRHQTLTLAGERGVRVTWTCDSRSITGPLTCHDGTRTFTMSRRPH
jgi:hypothetical protein